MILEVLMRYQKCHKNLDRLIKTMSSIQERNIIPDERLITNIPKVPEDLSGIFIPLVVLIIFIIFFGILGYLLISTNFESTNPVDRVAADPRSVEEIFTCPVGQCSTDLLTGTKVCPEENVALIINPMTSVCNSRYVCDNSITPFALQSDGSTNDAGICEPGIECNCLRYRQCPNYVLSAYTVRGGNVYQSVNGQRISFPQISTYINDQTGEVSTSLPIQYNDSTTFCYASLAWLPLSTPGCNFFSASRANNMTLENVVTCQGMISGCDGVKSSPCINGVLALITNDPDNIRADDVASMQFGCVRGEPCPCGMLAIYDTNYGGIICRNIE